MTGKNDGLKWLAWAIPAGLSLLIAFGLSSIKALRNLFHGLLRHLK